MQSSMVNMCEVGVIRVGNPRAKIVNGREVLLRTWLVNEVYLRLTNWLLVCGSGAYICGRAGSGS